MSSDLISRSALIESFRKCYVGFGYAEMEDSDSLMTFASICRVIKEEPVAYDMGKVVEQLEEIREEILTDTSYDNDTVNHYLGYADLMIEDVKAGGVNE